MPDELFGFTAEQVERLKASLQYTEAQELGRPQQHGRRRPWARLSTVVGFLDVAIAGISDIDDAPNSGTLSLYSYTSTGKTDTTENETVWHFETVNATTDRWTFANWDHRSGKYVLSYQACSTT